MLMPSPSTSGGYRRRYQATVAVGVGWLSLSLLEWLPLSLPGNRRRRRRVVVAVAARVAVAVAARVAVAVAARQLSLSLLGNRRRRRRVVVAAAARVIPAVAYRQLSPSRSIQNAHL